LVIINEKSKGKDKRFTKVCLSPTHNIMMMFLLEFNTQKLQKNYNDFVNELNMFSLVCANPECGVHGDCVKHGFYVRFVKTAEPKQSLKVLRVRCKSCKATHALLPIFIVPYSQIIIDDQIDIISKHLEGTNPYRIKPLNKEIDPWNIAYVISNFKKHWKAVLKSFSIVFPSKAKELSKSCFKHNKMQFMQIKRKPNLLLC